MSFNFSLQVKQFSARLLFNAFDFLSTNPGTPTFFKSEKEVVDLVDAVFGIAEPSKSEYIKDIKEWEKSLLLQPPKTFKDKVWKSG